jgi:hypothetical protein
MSEFLKEGDIVLLMKGHQVYTKLPRHFVYRERGNFDKSSRDVVEIGEDYSGLDTSFLIGKYIVVKTSMDGGTGPNALPGQDYPDGHHVYCQHADYPDLQVDFYQSGCFTATIKDIKPVGRAKAVWTVEPVNVRSWKA